MTAKKTKFVLASSLLLGSWAGSTAFAQGVEPTLIPPNPAMAAGQQHKSIYGPISMGETGVPVRDPLPPPPPPPPPLPPPPPPPPVVIPPPPPPLPPPPPPPLAPRPARN